MNFTVILLQFSKVLGASFARSQMELNVFTLFTEGRIVHVRKPEVSHCIPAIIVRTWGGSAINVLLFPDGSNDGYTPAAQDPKHGSLYGLPWMTSVPHESTVPPASTTASSWHFPERV